MRWRGVFSVTFVAMMASAFPLRAQLTLQFLPGEASLLGESSAEGGGFMEFIFKLSGPQFTGGMGNVSCGINIFNCKITSSLRPSEQPPLRIRLAAGKFWDNDYVSSPPASDTSDLTMTVLQATLELRLLSLGTTAGAELFIDIGGGYSHHKFGGDADDFTNSSIPMLAQLRVVFPHVTLRIGGGARRFTRFDTDAFEPVTVSGISTTGVEWAEFLSVGLDFHPRSR